MITVRPIKLVRVYRMHQLVDSCVILSLLWIKSFVKNINKLSLLISVKTGAVSRQAQGLWSGSGSGLTYVVTSLFIGP